MVKLYEVGGCVRDELLGRPSKDVDFAVVAESFEAMEAHIRSEGLKIFLSKPEFLTIRAGVPKGHKLRDRCKDADFVLCRKDGPTADGRRPEFVEPGTIFDDLARRDFTVNAIARCVETGEIIDPHGGQEDLRHRRLVFVGDGERRIEEDALRILRGIRFSVTKDLVIQEWDLFDRPMPASVSDSRIREELNKMFAFNTLWSLRALGEFPVLLGSIFSRPGLSLEVTQKKRK